MTSALAVCTGGFGTGGTTIFVSGNGVLPPSLNAKSREGPRFDSGVPSELPAPNSLELDPKPTGINTYCSPPAL